MVLNSVNSNSPGNQAIIKLNENDQINNGKADRGIFNKVELDVLYASLGNIRQYAREISLGHTTTSYTNWSHVEASDGYSVWKYPVVAYITNSNNEVYNNDIKMTYAGVASSESTVLGFNRVFSSNSKRTGATYTNNTVEAASSSGTPFNLTGITVVTGEVVSAVYGGVSITLDYENIIDGSVILTNATGSSAYVEDTDYTIGYASGTIVTLSAGSIASGEQTLITYNVGNTIYLGCSGTFSNINMSIATKGIGVRLAYNYSSGANWPSFTPTLDSTNNFSVDGNINIDASTLTGWTTATVNASAGLYWIKIRCTQAGISYPTAYHMVRADTAATKLLTMSQIDIANNEYKWCFFNANIYAAIPNNGTTLNEGVKFIKSTSDSVKKQNYFVYNNEYIVNYHIHSSGTFNVLNSVFISGDLTVGGNFNLSGNISMSGNLSLSGRLFVAIGTSAAPSYTFRTASDTGWFLDTSGKLCATVDGNRVLSLSSGSSTISLHRKTVISGALYQDGGAVFNDKGLDVDFRIESSAITNALFIDGGTGYIGINTGIPSTRLHVNGTTRLSGVATIVGELTVDNIKLDGSAITGTTDANTTITAYTGKAIVIESVSFDSGVMTGVTGITASKSDATAFVASAGWFSANGASKGLYADRATPLVIRNTHASGSISFRINGDVERLGISKTGAVTGITALTTGTIKITSGASNGYHLKSDALGNASWTQLTATADSSIKTTTTNYTAAREEVILCNASGGAITITLPPVANGMTYTIKKIDSSINRITIDGNASETIDGELTQTLITQYSVINLVCDGVTWWTTYGAFFKKSITTKTTTYTANYDEVVICNASGGAFTVTLPNVFNGVSNIIKKIDSSANAITINGTIDGVASQTLTEQYDSVNVICDGSVWYTI